MKIAITTSGAGLDGELDPRFGRAAAFIIYDTATREHEVVNNTQNLNAAQGAGIQSAQLVAEQGAEALITGHCGPKAFRVLKSAGIKVFTSDMRKITEAITAFENGELQEASDADVDGHW